MKFIKNSIDSEYLQDSLSDADLENQMANCEVKSEVLNGHNSDGIKISNKTNMEGVEVTKLSNGVHGKSGSPNKCNGKVNGFYEEEEDFNLVLEDSSEGSDSPSKKIDDDSISAPQIVQEIEDLLGITSSSAGIQEELNNLDGTESMEDCLDSVEDIEDSQDIQEVFEEIDVNKDKECKVIDGEKVDKIEVINKLPNKSSEKTECDTSSHMNLVFDEVEVGMENGDLSTPNEIKPTTKPCDTECKVESSTEANSEQVKKVVINETKDASSKDYTQGKNSEKCDVSVKSASDEITSTQSSSVSGCSEEWMVLDATETSDEEKLSEAQGSSVTVENIIDNLPLEKNSNSKDEIISEDGCLLSLPNNETVESVPLVKSSESNKLKSDADCTLSEQHENLTVETLDKPKVTSETTSSTFLPCEGDGVRKRCASIDDEEVELKKPKLEDQSCLVESSSPVLKRPSSVTTENESKRTKLSEITEECKTVNDENCQVNEKSDNARDEAEKQLMSIENESVKDNKIADVPINSTSEEKLPLNDEENLNKNVVPVKSTSEENPLVDSEESLSKNLVTDKGEETHTIASCSSKISNGNEDVVNSPSIAEQAQEKLISDVSVNITVQSNNVDSVSSKVSCSSPEVSKKTLEEDNHSLIRSCQTQLSKEILADSKIVGNEEPERKSEDNPPDCKQKSVNDENKENVSSSSIDTSKEEVGFKLDDLSSIKIKGPSKSDQAKSGCVTKTTNNIKPEPPKSVSMTKELSTSIKELERSLNKSGYEKNPDSRDLKNTEPKKMTNLDFAIERVVEKARIQTEKKVPILKKFHKDQLKKLKRSELEDVVVSKICEAVTYKSEIGQMRLRTQNLEETNEMWRKKVQQIEKQNRELEMVLKRFLAELAHIKRENQNKVPMPIKVTRSVGLQVVLASSMHGALVTSRSKINSEAAHQQQQQQQQQQTKVRQPEKEKEKVKEPVKATTFMPPSLSTMARGRGRPPKAVTTPTSRPSTPQTMAPKITPPTTPSKPANASPVKTIQTPNKDLEVIDLTDKEERAKTTSQLPVSGSIRVAPSTQMCFVQQSAASSSPQQPLYLVQKAGQRPQFLVASSASPQRPISNVARPPPAVLPVFRAGGHLIPVQTSTPMGVKTNTNTGGTVMARQIPTALRIQQQPTINKHPAPLPSAPAAVSKPGMKAPPPKPQLKIAKTSNGIMLSWSMSLTKEMADMQSYQLYAYQEGNQPPSTGLWKKVGDVKALPLPMACTLTQFIEGHKYHFAVRAVDTHGRIGPFSTPSSILLTK